MTKDSPKCPNISASYRWVQNRCLSYPPQVRRTLFSSLPVSAGNVEMSENRQALSPRERASSSPDCRANAQGTVMNHREGHEHSSTPQTATGPAALEEIKDSKHEKHVRNLQRELFQLANYYFVFQGVIFAAIFSGSSPLKCNHRWLPLTLSAIAGMLNLIALVTISIKLTEFVNKKELAAITGNGQRGDTNAITQGAAKETFLYKWRKGARIIILWSSVIMFVSFLIVVFVGSWKILCYKSDYGGLCSTNNCLRLCDDQQKCMMVCPESRIHC